ncbi:MAG: hypothetical protein NVS4B4_06770 [Bradyrhizobium sp.]
MNWRREHGHTHSHHGHDHDHDHDHRHDHHHDHGGPGHNRAPEHPVAQWQTPHRPGEHPASPKEPDLDKVEAAFIDGFIDAPDPVSFLRLGRIPFEMTAADGARLNLLRVEIDALADVGSLTPHLGGGSFRYDPLPASLVSHRRRLRFVYFDGDKLRPLTFADIRSP